MTVIEAPSAYPISLDEIVAVSVVLETNVVVRELPFQYTIEPVTKFVPLTVTVNPDAPTYAELGEREVMLGAGG